MPRKLTDSNRTAPTPNSERVCNARARLASSMACSADSTIGEMVASGSSPRRLIACVRPSHEYWICTRSARKLGPMRRSRIMIPGAGSHVSSRSAMATGRPVAALIRALSASLPVSALTASNASHTRPASAASSPRPSARRSHIVAALRETENHRGRRYPSSCSPRSDCMSSRSGTLIDVIAKSVCSSASRRSLPLSTASEKKRSISTPEAARVMRTPRDRA